MYELKRDSKSLFSCLETTLSPTQLPLNSGSVWDMAGGRQPLAASE